MSVNGKVNMNKNDDQKEKEWMELFQQLQQKYSLDECKKLFFGQSQGILF